MSEIPRPISPEKFDEIVQTVNMESGTGDGGLADDSLQDLVEKVVHGFVTCLQKDSVDIWQSFNEILEIIQPYSILIQENAQLTHYARRAYNHVFVNPNCGLDVKALSLAFPKEIAELRKDESTNNRKIKFPAGSPHQSEVDLQFKRVNEKKGISILKRAVIPSSGIYNDDIERAKYVLPRKKLHIGDLRKSLPFVVHEIGLREASWGRPLGMTAVALNVDLAEMLPATSPKDSGSYLTEDFLADSLKLAQDNKTSLVEKAERRPLTGQEVVEKFIKGHFLGMTKFAYLNQVQSKYYNPYNLVVVPRKKREPEHYVMSPHAILHVIPNGPSELQPLVEWYKEAILFTALLKFSFFKNFLAAKMFQKWKRMKKMSQFRALCDHIAQAMVLCIPSFGSALLRIFSLIQDMDQVQFLPLDDLRCKPLQEFNSITVKLLEDAQECLKMFFTYCLSVINKTRENCFDYLEYCKEQLERKSGNPKGSLSLAKERKAIKEQNLKLAKHEIYQLGKFFKLVEHILAAKLLTLARYNIGTFVNKVLGGEEIKELGYISISLEFDKRDKLVLVPTPDRLQGSLFYAIESVLKILCHSSESLDSEFCDSGGDRNHSDDSPTSLSSDRSDSKPPDGTSPNRLSSVRFPQSSVLSVPSTHVPALSVCSPNSINRKAKDQKSHQTYDAANGTAKPRGNAEHFKNLLTESLKQTLESSKETVKEDCPESAEVCISSTGGLLVEGREMQLEKALTSPLSKARLEVTVLKDEEILEAISKVEKMVDSALQEVNEFCRKHEWTTEINNFVRTWNANVLSSWRGRPPGEIQRQLAQIKTWIEEVKNVEKSFTTKNGLLHVDCSSIHDSVIPKLNAVFIQMTKMVAKDLHKMSADFSNKVTELAEELSSGPHGLIAFAEFTLVQRATKEKVPSLQMRVEYIKSLFEMIRTGYRQLTPMEEEAEERAWASWERFLLCLQESSDFLVLETPHVLRDLEETIMTLEHQARFIGKKALSGEFLIPENDPPMILSQLKELQQRLWSILNDLNELSKCREALCGGKYNKSHLLQILSQVDVRYELWKYYDVSGHTINDWLQMPFRKVNVKKVTEKVTEWQLAAQNLKSSLQDGDEVYESWINLMESFMKDFPLLQQLSSDALKQRHWKALFVGMGQQCDANLQFTIADLYSLKLGLHRDLIDSVCCGAQQEYSLELRLRSLAKMWTDKDFKLAKYFARTRSPVDVETESSAGKSPTKQKNKSRLNYSRVTEMYILTGDDELKCLIEDNRVTLQLMLVSPYVADLKPLVQKWMKNLEQLEEILELWVACQKKWLYLSLVFTESSAAYGKAAVSHFEHIDHRFKEFMQTVVRDSKVLSSLAKRKGEKGYRELQGEALRSMLFSLLKAQEELLKSVEHNMEKVRETFPRLYFLSDNDLLDIMVTSRDPQELVPVVRKCFLGIKSLKFGLPEDSTTKLGSELDAALNAHLLQVAALEGKFGEIMVLPKPLPADTNSQIWLKALEKSMKTAVMMNLTKCMVDWLSRRKYKTTVVSDILGKGECEETDFVDKTGTSKIKPKSRPLEIPCLLKYPSQCLRSVEAAVWSIDMCDALSSEDKNEIQALSSFTNRRVEDYSKVLSGKEYSWLTNLPSIRPTLESLVACAIHHRDVVERILACKSICLHCFEWQSCLQHYISLKQVVSTTYYSGLKRTTRHESSQDQIPLDVKYETEEYSISLLGSEFPYGFEYLSEHVSLVMTPLTERCFLALTMALKQYSCGAPLGYSGTGKTETANELAKMMGRHLVIFNCPHSMAGSVATRLLTGMISSGSWICFEGAQNLSQQMLTVLAEYLGCIRESYKCLLIDRRNQYFVKGTAGTVTAKDAKESNRLRRSQSLTTLDPLAVSETPCVSATNVKPRVTTKSTAISRRFSIAEGRNIDKARYYGNGQPLPISIPLKAGSFTSDHATDLPEKEEAYIAYQQPNDSFLGNIVLNGLLLKAHPMAGCFMTITPSSDGHVNLPENLKVSLRTVAMMLPDMKRIVEVWLLCNGFNNVETLAEKIMFFVKVIQEEVPPECNIRTNTLKIAIRVAGNKLKSEKNTPDNAQSELAGSDQAMESQLSEKEVEDIASATSFLKDFESRTREENALVYGLFSVLCPKLDENSKKLVCELIDTVFTHTVLSSSTESDCERVAQAVKEQLNVESMQPNMDLVSKVIQLYQVLQTNHAVIIMGSSGTGKTTIYQTLCGTINSLNTKLAHDSSISGTTHTRFAHEVERKYPKVNLSVLFPRAMNEDELFGWTDPVTKLWVDGILVKRARNALAVKNASESLSSKIQRGKRCSTIENSSNSGVSNGFHQWIVLDGPIDHGWLDQMNSLFEGNRSLTLGNGEMVPISENMHFLLELDDLQNGTPSVVGRCGIVYCPDGTVGWKNIFKSWLKGAHGKWNISMRGLGIVSSLVEHCMEKTLTFLSNQCSSILYTNYFNNQLRPMGARGVHEIQRLLAILSSLFDKHILRDNDEAFDIVDQLKDQRCSLSPSSNGTESDRSSCISASDTYTVVSSFAYAFIWAFGGGLHESCIEMFDEFVKGLLSTGPYPHISLPSVSVFDFHLDFPTGSLLSSTEKLSGETRTVASSYVVVPRVEVYFSLLDLLISANKPVLLVGPPGSGKTSFMQNLINPRFNYTRVSLAHGTTTQLLHEAIEAKVQNTKHRRSVVNDPTLLAQTSRNLFFFDDLNSAATDGTGSNNQLSLELMRSLLSLGGLYDRQRLCLKPLHQMSVVGAAVPPGYPGIGGVASFPISPRLARIMVVLSFLPVSGATLRSIYRNLLQSWLEDFPAYSLTHHRQLAKVISSSSVTMFERISEEFRPTPLHPHYIFTHHDVARVMQGMMLFSSRTKSRPRPKARHTWRMVTDMVQNARETTILNDRRDSLDLGNASCQEQSNLHQEKSLATVAPKGTLISVSSKTPAVLTPMIRVLLRLWCHECARVFSDRLIGEDKLWFSSTLHKVAVQHFCETSADSDEQDHLDVSRDRMSAEESRDPSTGSFAGDVDSGEDMKTKGEESGQDGNFSGDDTSLEERQKSGKDFNLNNEKIGGHVVREDDESPEKLNNVEPVIVRDTSPSFGQKPHIDSRMTDENSMDDFKVNSQETSLPRTAPSKQRVVTFEDMSREHTYRGPLISSDQLMEPGEDLAKIVFCRHFVSTVHENGPEQDRGYSEYSMVVLAERLKQCQQLYNSRERQPLDLVFFEQAVRHAARISRCLSLANGHMVLLSGSGQGRKSLVLLVSFAASYKLITLRGSRRDDARERMKGATYVAGLQGKPVVLFVPENIGEDIMHDVCSLISEGNCPGLFSAKELISICGELIPGGQKRRRNENIAVAQERFFRRVRVNLHVVVCLQYPSEKLDNLNHSTLTRLPFLTTRVCGVDVYQQWNQSVLINISSQRLANIQMDPHLLEVVNFHRTSVASVMSYIHTSALEMVNQQFGFNHYQCYSPATFVEFVDMFGKCCNRMWKEQQGKVKRCQQALGKVREADYQISEMQKDSDSFVPALRKAEQEVKECQQLVESLQRAYAKGREKCKQQEVEIEKMMAPIEELERLAKIQLDKVSPVFRSAYDALQALNVYDVEEIRSYRSPPEQVLLVVNAVCLLFGKEENWEEGKVLFSRDDFIKDLEFFNMKAISDRTFCGLKGYIDNPKFVPELVKEGSRAAMSICIWIRAVYHFCVVYREYFPKQQRVVEAKKILKEAVSYLGDLRVRCNEIKAEVEAKIEDYKEKVHHARSIEKQIQLTEQRKSRAVSVIQNMSKYVKSWEKTLSVSQYHIKTLTGDALLTAACVCYLGPLGQETRDKLLRDWKIACLGSTGQSESENDDDSELDIENNATSTKELHQGLLGCSTSKSIPFIAPERIPVRRDFKLKEILSTEEELYCWRYSGLPVNLTAVENALMMRTICELSSRHWPLLIDTDLQSYMWIKCLHQTMDTKDDDDLDSLGSNPPLENSVNEQIFSLSVPVSPCPTYAEPVSEEDRSTNYDESDSTPLNSNQSSRRTSAVGSSGLLIREDLEREFNIQTSPLDYTSTDSASTNVDFDDEEIIIISATDKQRDVKICGAVSIGATVMLVDVERRKLGAKLDNLISRNIFIDKNGKRKIKIGNRCIDYHPSFRLYLHSNMPLELGTENMTLHFKKCLTINMALSCDGLQEQLLSDVLSLERPEYESQRRSLEADIHHHKQQIENAENSIVDRVINLHERLLENTAISNALKECDELCDTARQQLEESKALYELAKEKQEDYAYVAEHGAALLVIVSKLSKLHSYYQTPLHTSLRLFREVILRRRRRKRLTVSSLARSAELITYITRSMCSKIARSLFSDHYDVFTVLVAVEKLRLADQVPENEWELFCRSTPQTPIRKHTSDSSKDEGIPFWISSELWGDIVELDALPSFRGLKECIQRNDELWKEYFDFPPVLMAPTPRNFQQLSVFQRALLWKTFRKDKLHNVCKDLVLHQLGTNARAVTSFSIDQVYQDSTCITPVIFFLPKASCENDWRNKHLKDPVDEILALAQRCNMNDKLRLVKLGGELETTELSHILRNACENGLWVIIQSCHLIADWSPELMNIFYQITLAGSKERIMSKHGIFEVDANPYTVTSCEFTQPLVMNPRFRLWLITSPEIGTPLPAVLIRYGVKLAWDDKLEFETSVQESFVAVWNKLNRSNKRITELQIEDVQVEPLLPYLHCLALFHSILHRRHRYGSRAFNVPYHWRYSDLSWGLEAIRLLKSSVFCSCSVTSSQSSALQQTISILYGGQVPDLLDWKSIVALSEAYSTSPNKATQTTNEIPVRSIDVLFSRLPVTVKLNDLGLNESLSVEHDIHISNQLSTNISKALGILPKPTWDLKPLSYFQKIFDTLEDIKNLINLEPNNENVEREESSFDAFLKLENLRYLELLNGITSQLEGIIKGLKGDVSFNPNMRKVAMLLSRGTIPKSWNRSSKSIPTLTKWIINLKGQIQAIIDYRRRPPAEPVIVHMAVFINKQSMLYNLMIDWSKESGKPVHMMDLSAEVLRFSTIPQLTVVEGVYLTGLVLCNASWNETESCIEEPKEGECLASMPPVLLKTREETERQIDCNKEDKTFYCYNCPVYFYDDLRRSGPTTPLTYIPVRSHLPSNIWQQRQVFISSSM